MSKGKTAAQVAHAACRVFAQSPRDRVWRKWKSEGSPKIVTKAPEATLREIHTQHPDITYPIIDAGATELPPSTFTTLGVRVMTRSDVPTTISSLRLL